MSVDNRDILIVLTNLPDRAAATRLPALLVEHRHAACVNIVGEGTSVYWWEGKIRMATEVPLLIKTSASAYPGLEEKIRSNHPYKVPEIVSLAVGAGLTEYLGWVAAQTIAR